MKIAKRFEKINKTKWSCYHCGQSIMVHKNDLILLQLGDRMASMFFTKCSNCNKLRMLLAGSRNSKFLISIRYKKEYFRIQGSTSEDRFWK
jgi:hypothetical protein